MPTNRRYYSGAAGPFGRPSLADFRKFVEVGVIRVKVCPFGFRGLGFRIFKGLDSLCPPPPCENRAMNDNLRVEANAETERERMLHEQARPAERREGNGAERAGNVGEVAPA